MPAIASFAIEQKTNDPILFMCNFLLSLLHRRDCNEQKNLSLTLMTGHHASWSNGL